MLVTVVIKGFSVQQHWTLKNYYPLLTTTHMKITHTWILIGTVMCTAQCSTKNNPCKTIPVQFVSSLKNFVMGLVHSHV